MVFCDRGDLQMWARGTMIHYCKGKGIAVDEEACEKAHNALERGEEVALTTDGEIVSYIKKIDGVFKEFSEESSKNGQN